ncbi:MAG: universal stress protein [Pseudomonadota bacterium]
MIKTILVHVDRDSANHKRCAAAFTLAERFGAHLIACHPVPPANVYVPSSLVPMSAADIIPQLQDIARRTAARLREEFARQAPKAGPGWEWVEETGEPSAVLTDRARLADLTLVSLAPASPKVDDPTGLAGDLAIAGGLPVLALPTGGKTPAKDKPVLVAWNGSMEAARAIRASLGFLQQACEVVVLEVGEEKPATLPAAELGPYLARHGLKVSARRDEPDETVGETILKVAHAVGAEMIVMGAYGHSRLREFVFGGVTRFLLHQNAMPIFVTH